MGIIIFLLGAVFIGFILAGLFAPIILMSNRKHLKEMDRLIDAFEGEKFSSSDEKEKAKQALKRKLIQIKGKIVSDKKSQSEAADKINIL